MPDQQLPSVPQSDYDKSLLRRVENALTLAEPYHQKWRARASHFWGLWDNVQDARQHIASQSTERGRDQARRDVQSTFGAEMFIPIGFWTVETVLPKILGNRPTMKASPRDPDSADNVTNVEFLVAAQQEQMDYELVLQTIAKDGLVTGLGIQKIGWKSEYRRRTRLVPSMAPRSLNPTGFAEAQLLEQVYDDPEAIAVDPFDFLWDPYAASIDNAEFVIHRTWRTNDYVAKKIQLGKWRNITPEQIERLDSSRKYDEIWKDRLNSSKIGAEHKQGDRRLHEVLEFHDGDQVIVTLDRQAVVASGENPFWHGEKPFQSFRPTERTHQLPGKGLIEPLEDLQEEMNVLRRQRRDNASFKLQQVVAYADGVVEQGDIAFFPGAAIPVQGGVDPKDALWPINVGDIPYSGYQEEDRLRADVDRTSGLSDPVMGVAQTGQTATAAQLVYQSASERIKNQTTRLELEIINPGTRQMVELDQQKILTPRAVPIPMSGPQISVAPSEDGEGFRFVGADPERRWAWRTLGPKELAGNFAWQAGLSTMPDNIPQKRSDAETFWTLAQDNPNLEQRKVLVKVLELLDIKDPESYLAPPEAKVPPQTLDILVQNGVPQEEVAAALNEALTGQAPPTPAGASQNGAPTPQEVSSNGSR